MERLRQSPRLALRALLGEQLQAATEAAARLKLSGETEALHDFRVALRRLHTLLRVYRDDLDHKLRLLNKRVRGLAHATNALRDREVHIAWLREQHRQTPSTARAALAALIDELQNQQTRAAQTRYPQLQTRFAALAIELCRCLQAPADARARRARPTLSFAQAAARRLRVLGNKLARRLAQIKIADQDGDAVHAARIAGKRLRYVLEPMRTGTPGAHRLLLRLKTLQDLLGDIHDCALRIAELDTSGVVHAASERTRLRRAAQRSRAELLQRLEAEWSGAQVDVFLAPLWRVIARLSCVVRGRAAQRAVNSLKRGR